MRHRGVTVDQDHLVGELRLWGMSLVLCGLIFGFDRIGFLEWFRGGLERGVLAIDAQIIQGGHWVWQPVEWVWQARQASERIANLEERLTKISVDQAKLKALEAQVSVLEALSLRVQSGQRADRLAQLIQYHDRIMVVAGSRDGLMAGQVVTDQGGALLGRVGKVGRYMSEIDTLDNETMRLPVQTLSGSSKGILLGKGTQKTELTGVLQSEPLAVGDVLVTVGTESGFPPNLVVGQIAHIIGKPEDVTKGGMVALLGHLEGWVAIW